MPYCVLLYSDGDVLLPNKFVWSCVSLTVDDYISNDLPVDWSISINYVDIFPGIYLLNKVIQHVVTQG